MADNSLDFLIDTDIHNLDDFTLVFRLSRVSNLRAKNIHRYFLNNLLDLMNSAVSHIVRILIFSSFAHTPAHLLGFMIF